MKMPNRLHLCWLMIILPAVSVLASDATQTVATPASAQIDFAPISLSPVLPPIHVRPTASQADRAFIASARLTASETIATARSVQEQSTNRDIRDLARVIERGYLALDARLAQLPGAKRLESSLAGIGVVSTPLQPLPGSLEYNYLRVLVSSHLQSIERFERAVSDGRNTQQVRQFAGDALPELRRHVVMAEMVGDLLNESQQLLSQGLMY